MKLNSSDYSEEADLALFKKKLKLLKKFKGKGTELISVYIPPSADRSSVMGQLTEELSQSSNIKSPTTRKNVQGALRKVSNFLKNINFKIPKNGLAVFCGNISETEGRSNIKLFTVRPVVVLKTKLYWCDSEFHLAPLQEMTKPIDSYAIISLDKREAVFALLTGKKYEILAKFTSGVPGKFRAGGQCLAQNSLIMLSDGNIIEISNCHNPSGIKTADFKEGVVRDSFINDKWNSLKQGYFKITTKAPRMQITCSKEHAFFCWENGIIKEKTAENIRVGEFLLMPEKIRVNGINQRLENNFFNSFIILDSGREKIIEARKKKGLLQKQLAEKLNLHQANISAIELGKLSPRYKTVEKLCKELEIDFNGFLTEHCKPNTNLMLPKELDKELAQFIGYFLGDGCFEKERISFFEQRKEVAEKYKELAKKFFNANTHLRFRESKNYFELRVYGKPIVRFLKENFPELNEKDPIPKKILKSKEEVLAGFVKGLFDAEGYATKHHVALGMNNEKIVRQLQLSLLRFGIIASIHEYDSNKNPYSKKHSFTIQINEKESLELFEKNICFTAKEKTEKLAKLIHKTTGKSNVRQISVSGKQVREIIEKHGFKVTDFPRVTNFFRNERMMGKEVFRNSILKFAKNKELLGEMEKVLGKELLPVKISRIEKKQEPMKMIDISVENKNFIANGLIAHNSAHRFERLREEAALEFYKRIAEKMSLILLPLGEKLRGIIVGGPGATKNYFLEIDEIDYRLRKKIIGVVDVAYADESGVREIFFRAEDLLKETDLVKERTIINNFLGEIAKNGLAAYGRKEVEEALAIGKVSVLLVSEDLSWGIIKSQCSQCNNIDEKFVENIEEYDETKEKCSKCQSNLVEVLEEIDYLDYLLEKAQKTNAETKVVSTETIEGEQFFKGFGGIGAILRYK